MSRSARRAQPHWPSYVVTFGTSRDVSPSPLSPTRIVFVRYSARPRRALCRGRPVRLGAAGAPRALAPASQSTLTATEAAGSIGRRICRPADAGSAGRRTPDLPAGVAGSAGRRRRGSIGRRICRPASLRDAPSHRQFLVETFVAILRPPPLPPLPPLPQRRRCWATSSSRLRTPQKRRSGAPEEGRASGESPITVRGRAGASASGQPVRQVAQIAPPSSCHGTQNQCTEAGIG